MENDICLDPRVLDEAVKRLCELSLYDYVQEAWRHIESADFIDNFHIGAICDHLQAVADGQIKKLLINVPPGCSKSLLTSVFFPTWMWVTKPQTRFFYASYDQSLSTRDSVKCRALIQGPWYHGLWYDRYHFVNDQNQKQYFENNHRGYRLATSVGGHGTGEHPDIIVCFPPDETVLVREGLIPIERIVKRRMRTEAWSVDVATGRFSWKPVVGWIQNPGRDIVRVDVSDGSSVRCTPDHRLWVVGRGWVEARDMQLGDVLPNVPVDDVVDGLLADSELIREGNLLAPSGVLTTNIGDLDCRQLGVASPVSWAPGTLKVLRHRLPPCTSPDRVNRPYRHAMECSQFGGRPVAAKDGCGTGSCQLVPFLFAEPYRSVSLGVVDVLLASAVGKVFQSVVVPHAVQVPCFHAIWARPDECEQYATMHENLPNLSVDRRVKPAVSLVKRRRVEFFGGNAQRAGFRAASLNHTGGAADSPVRGDLVSSTARDHSKRLVVGVRHEGFSTRTYCLTVADNHTLCVGGTQATNATSLTVAAQCDDPHNVREAESEAARAQVKEWWDLTMTTRGVSRNAARVVIMQRLHANDLSGHILKDGGYVHICLPMRYEPDRMVATPLGFADPRQNENDLLAPAQFDEEKVQAMERGLGIYGTAGQLQQRPAPKEGGMFHTEWLPMVSAAPEAMPQIVRWWDFAATQDDGDYTSGAKLGRSVDGRYFILDITRGQWSSAERDQKIKQTAMMDGVGVHQWCEQEPGSAGKTVAENFVRMLDGYTAKFEPTRGDKVRNAEPLASQAQVGGVYVVEDREAHRWNAELLDEFRMFPKGANDDIVDSVSKAFNKLATMAHAIISHDMLRYFDMSAHLATVLHVAKTSRDRVIDTNTCQRVAIIKCGAGDHERVSLPPWTAMQIWEYDPGTRCLMLRHGWRSRVVWGDMVDKCVKTQSDWQVRRVLVIRDEAGIKLSSIMRGTCEVIANPANKLLELSIPLQEMMRKERVLIPAQRESWVKTVESEWTSWTGDDDDVPTLVVASYAARYFSKQAASWGGTVVVDQKQTVPYHKDRF